MSAPFVLAVPSKGRLQENAEAFFARAGLKLSKAGGARDYRGTIAGLDNVEVAYLSASEIASQLSRGLAHLGVTGEDLVREKHRRCGQARVADRGLGFGYADVVVAVPQAWIDVRTMADLDDVDDRLPRTASHADAGRDQVHQPDPRNSSRQHGIVDYRIVESAGATEGAPAAGSAELIVDITTTGATLAANGLRVLDDGVILRSQANLVASRDADWSPEARETARIILDHIAARARANKYKRGPDPLPAVRRRAARRSPQPVRRRGSVRRADLLGHADAALPAGPALCARPASCANTAPRPYRWSRSTTCSTGKTRCSPSSKRSCGSEAARFDHPLCSA